MLLSVVARERCGEPERDKSSLERLAGVPTERLYVVGSTIEARLSTD
jgi:hypothetical protein